MERKVFIDQNISNLDLLIAMKTQQANPTMEGQIDFINQLLRAKLLCPSVFEPEPEVLEDGSMKAAPDQKMFFTTVSSKDQKRFLIAYTDKREANKSIEDPKVHTVITTYMDYCNFILPPESPYEGVVINPFSENFVLTKQIMLDIHRNIQASTGVSMQKPNPMGGSERPQ